MQGQTRMTAHGCRTLLLTRVIALFVSVGFVGIVFLLQASDVVSLMYPYLIACGVLFLLRS